MLTSIITAATSATKQGSHKKIEHADIGVSKAWQLSMCNMMIDRIILAN